MTRHIVLLVCSDDERLPARHGVVRRAGHTPLHAPTISRAIVLMHKVRPSLVLTDPELPDGYAHALLRALRAIVGMGQVMVVVLGVLPAEQHAHVAQDPHVFVRQVDNDQALGEVLTEHLRTA